MCIPAPIIFKLMKTVGLLDNQVISSADLISVSIASKVAMGHSKVHTSLARTIDDIRLIKVTKCFGIVADSG